MQEEQSASCQHLTELQNLTKGPCYLDQVEVSYCSGHCPSSTNIMPENRKLLVCPCNQSASPLGRGRVVFPTAGLQ
ncbi:SCO-spondin [Manis javanica]|nr:SCO-spondin [Manis javanica]